jgi:prophage regulatory protein
MKSTVNSTPRLGHASSVHTSRRKIPQIGRGSQPQHRLEFLLQDAKTLAMEPTTSLPCPPTGDTPRVLARLPMVLKLTGLGRSTIYRWIADGSFPPPVRLGPRAVAWRWSDLDRWTQSRDIAQH